MLELVAQAQSTPHPQRNWYLSKVPSGAGKGVDREQQDARGKDFPGKGVSGTRAAGAVTVKREEKGFWDDKEP